MFKQTPTFVEPVARGAHSLALRAAISHVHLHGGDQGSCGDDPMDVLRRARGQVRGGDTTADVRAADGLLHA